MARLARLSVGGCPHLLALRGAHGASIVRSDADREQFLVLLRQANDESRLALHGYALLPDAVYLLATPPDAAVTGRAVQALGRRYVRWFNDRHARHGALFDGRFRSALLEADAWLLPCLRYVESRVVAAGLVADATDYRWSSARHHGGIAPDALLADPAAFWALGNTPFERQAAWRHYLGQGTPAAEAQQIAQALMGGWALGSRAFLEELGRTAPRRAVPGRPGRPRRSITIGD